MVGVQQGVDGGVSVREDNTEIGECYVDPAVRAEGLDAVDGVERDPADHEEEDDDGEVLCGFHFTFLCGSQHA